MLFGSKAASPAESLTVTRSRAAGCVRNAENTDKSLESGANIESIAKGAKIAMRLLMAISRAKDAAASAKNTKGNIRKKENARRISGESVI